MCAHYEHLFDREGTERGLEHGERAVALDPGLARAWLLLFFLYMRSAEWHAKEPEAMRQRANDAIRKAYALDPRDAKIVCEMGMMSAAADDVSGAAALFYRAEDLGSNQGDVLSLLANAFTLILGRPTYAQSLLDKAYRLNPFPPRWYNFAQSRVAYFAGDYERCCTVTVSIDDVLAGALYGALAAVQLETSDATERVQNLTRRFPHFDPHAHARAFPIKDPAALERYFEGIESIDQILSPSSLTNSPER